jgi:hypothetical protein
MAESCRFQIFRGSELDDDVRPPEAGMTIRPFGCLLPEVKRTSSNQAGMSVMDPKHTEKMIDWPYGRQSGWRKTMEEWPAEPTLTDVLLVEFRKKQR